MEKKEQIRLVIALVLSFIVIFGWQYLMAPSAEEQAEIARKAVEAERKAAALSSQVDGSVASRPQGVPTGDFVPTEGVAVTVDTPLYTAVFSSQGGILEKFILKNYRETIKPDSPNVDLIGANAFAKGPLGLILTAGDKEFHTWQRGQWAFAGSDLSLGEGDGARSLTFTGQSGDFRIERTLTFDPATYHITESAMVTTLGNTGVEGAVSFTAAAKSMSAEGDSYNPTKVAYLSADGREEMSDRDDLKEKGLASPAGLKWGGRGVQLLPVRHHPGRRGCDAFRRSAGRRLPHGRQRGRHLPAQRHQDGQGVLLSRTHGS